MLYIVGTPIGNMKDITLRALEVLRSVDEIGCEDTRHTLGLLNAYEIKKPLFACHKFNERSASEKIIEKLKSGKNIAIVTDAGMPLISDPGCLLVKSLIENGLEYTVIPGATAFVCALIMSGLLDYRFSFIGFLPDKNSECKKLLKKYENADCPLVFYCAPHDVDETVKRLYNAFGNRKAVCVREITKTFEQRVEFELESGYNGEKKGEFVIIVDGAKETETKVEMPVNEHIALYLAKGYTKKDAIKAVAKDRGVTKNEIYMQAIDSDESDGGDQ